MPNKYLPGFQMHFIHARLTRESPWGWRDGLVVESSDGTHVIDYTQEDGQVTVWSDALKTLPLGAPVRVHEGLHALEVAGRWFNVRIDAGGLGSVPEPADKSGWAPQGYGIVDLATGTAIGTPPPTEPDVSR